MFRSEKMGFYNLVMPRESAWDIMNELGELDALEFVDLNPGEAAFNRPYANYIKRCDEMEVKLLVIEAELTKQNKEIERCQEPKSFLENLKEFLQSRNKAERTYFEDVETELDASLEKLNQQLKNTRDLIVKRNEWIELKYVLQYTKDYVTMRPGDSGAQTNRASIDLGHQIDFNILEGASSGTQSGFSYMAGTIASEEANRFKRMIFRTTKGNALTIIKDMEPLPGEEEAVSAFIDPETGEASKRSVYLIIYQGGSYDTLKTKLNRICDSFGCSKFGLPENVQQFDEQIKNTRSQIDLSTNVLNASKIRLDDILSEFTRPKLPNSNISYIEEMRVFILKEKAIYHNLNKLKLQNTIFHGSCWCPTEDVPRVMSALQDLQVRKPNIAGGQLHEVRENVKGGPPSLFRVNEFTWPFQEIVNTYGPPRYGEVNPGLFTIITFPFLFGVMFGDIGHGFTLFCFAVYLCLWADNIKKEKTSMLKPVVPVRYLLLLMGIFATYAGFIYNDFLSIPLTPIPSCYTNQDVGGITVGVKDPGCTYPFGVDPKWYVSSNELTYFNSLKMKLSIVLGVSHMVLGIFLKAFNTIHFGQYLDFFFEFLPQIIFMLATFGYMVACIFIKWITPWEATGDKWTPGPPPSIIALFIDMVLKGGDASNNQLYDFENGGRLQSTIQLILLLTAVICIPLMLFPKPIILYFTLHKEQAHQPEDRAPLLVENDSSDSGHPAHHTAKKNDHDEEHDFSEIVVHTLIETIEFVLGSISNTASYLRLWALSLAHAQLAKVFFDKTISSFIASGNFIGLFFAFVVFAIVTFFVLMCMDAMECFLHSLRLHWVEFQSKFYKADGRKFAPFSFVFALMEEPAKSAQI